MFRSIVLIYNKSIWVDPDDTLKFRQYQYEICSA